MTVVAPGNFDDRGLEAAYRRSLATPFRIACLVPTLTAVSLAFGPPVNCNVFVPSRLGMLLEDAIRYFGAAIAVASMFCTQARLFDDHLDAFCVMIPYALYLVSLSRASSVVYVDPLISIFGSIVFSLRFDLRWQFGVFLLAVCPSVVATGDRPPMESLMILITCFVFYIACTHQGRVRRRVFLTSDALWQRAASAAAMELEFYQQCVADYVQLGSIGSEMATVDVVVPGDEDGPRSSPSTINGASSRWSWSMSKAVIMCIEIGPPFDDGSVESAPSQCVFGSTIERQMRDMLRFLSSLVLADGTGDMFLVTSRTSAAILGLHAERGVPVASSVLSCLAHIPKGPLLAVVEAYILASRIPKLVERAVRGAAKRARGPPRLLVRGIEPPPKVACSLHVGRLTLLKVNGAPSNRNGVPITKLWAAGRDVGLAQRLCREAASFAPSCDSVALVEAETHGGANTAIPRLATDAKAASSLSSVGTS